jgi:tetratricopeptide (TPR) repeat protein
VHRTTLADLLLAQGRATEAADLLLPVAEAGRLDWRSQLLLADLLSTLGRDDEAWRLVRDLLDQGFDGPLISRLAGEIALERDDLESAERYLRQSVRKDPEDPDAVLSLLLLLSRRGTDGGEAVPADDEEFDRLLDLATELVQEGSLRQSFLLGAFLRRAGREEEAIVHLTRASELDPENPQILFDLAVCQEASGRHRETAETLEALLALEPDDAQVLNFYGYLLAEQGWELERAETMIVRALEQEPDNAFYLDSLGWVYYQQGRHEEALDKLIDASNRLGDDPVVLEHIGDTLVALGRYDRALTIYERALAAGGEPADLQPRLDEVRRHLRESP